jgi:hypothetical protein
MLGLTLQQIFLKQWSLKVPVLNQAQCHKGIWESWQLHGHYYFTPDKGNSATHGVEVWVASELAWMP